MSDDFHFNAELALDDDTRADLAQDHAAFAFALHTKELAEPFLRIDDEAKRQKKDFRKYGLWAIFLVWLALVVAAIEMGFILPVKKDIAWLSDSAKWVAGFAAFAGIAGIGIGWLRMGIRKKKFDWLKGRLKAERIRQWHWQYLLTHLDEATNAALGPEAAIQQYEDKRATEFRRFLRRLEKNATAQLSQQLSRARDDRRNNWVMRHSLTEIDAQAKFCQQASGSIEQTCTGLLDAYSEIRLDAQSDYIGWMLGKVRFWIHPRQQIELLHNVGLGCVALIGVLHVLLILGVLADVTAFKSPAVYVATIILALTALAVRSIEEGLGPHEQIGRVKAYHNACETARNRYEHASLAEKFQIMCTHEETAAREMNDFLRAADHRRYVM